jgi:hypothetical protein
MELCESSEHRDNHYTLVDPCFVTRSLISEHICNLTGFVDLCTEMVTQAIGKSVLLLPCMYCAK